MVSDYGPGHDAEASFQRAFKAAGGEIIGSGRIPLANPDFSTFVQRAKDANPEGIFVYIPGGSQPPALAKALTERGMDPSKIKIMGQGELTNESALKAMGDSAIGIITALHYDQTHNSKMNKAFVEAYNAEFKRNPDFFSVGGYDGMHIIYEALKKTNGNTDGEGLIDATKGMAWESREAMSRSIPTPATSSIRCTSARSRKSTARSRTSRSRRLRTSKTRAKPLRARAHFRAADRRVRHHAQC